MNKTATDVRKALQTEEGAVVTLAQLQAARAIYKEIAQEAYKSKDKDYSTTNLALSILTNAFFQFLENTDELNENIKRTIFMSDKGYGYNAVLASVENGEFENIFSIKIKHESQVEKLIRDHGFYLNY